MHTNHSRISDASRQSVTSLGEDYSVCVSHHSGSADIFRIQFLDDAHIEYEISWSPMGQHTGIAPEHGHELARLVREHLDQVTPLPALYAKLKPLLDADNPHVQELDLLMEEKVKPKELPPAAPVVEPKPAAEAAPEKKEPPAKKPAGKEKPAEIKPAEPAAEVKVEVPPSPAVDEKK